MTYEGVLTSYMTAQQHIYMPLDSLEQLKTSHWKWLRLDRNKALVDGFMTDKTLSQKYVPLPKRNDALKEITYSLNMILKNPNTYALPTPEMILNIINMYYGDVNGQHEFYIGKEPFNSFALSFMIRKGISYGAEFDKCILICNEMGLSNYYIQKVTDAYATIGRRRARLENRQIKTESTEMVKLKHLTGFGILSLGVIAASLLLLGVEVVCHKFENRIRQILQRIRKRFSRLCTSLRSCVYEVATLIYSCYQRMKSLPGSFKLSIMRAVDYICKRMMHSKRKERMRKHAW